MKLLVVEDEEKMGRLLQRGLGEEGHQVDLCARGMDALEQARSIPYDVIVLDWGLPDVDGLAVLRALRERGQHTPVLLLTARGSVGERVAGLRTGADDYLPKPFAFEELLARLEALHRRSAGSVPQRALGPVHLDAHRRALAYEGREQPLTSREYQLLCELADHAGEVVTRTELLTAVWGHEFAGNQNVVDVYVGYLRNKLRALGEVPVAIGAVRGVGYRLEVVGRPAAR